MRIPLSRPDITEKEIISVVSVLRTPHLCLGPKLAEFEKKIAEFIDVRYAVGVNSGTGALHLIIRALDIKDNDEVITTPFSFIASSNCILYERARPVFVDIEPRALTIDAGKIEEKITKKTKAILAVDVFGHPAQWDVLTKISQKYKLKLIEDSAESLGSEYKGKKAGSFGDAGVFAFYPNKQITTGEGGVILTNSKRVADVSRSMRNQGRDSNGVWLNHVRLGYNYRLSDIHCALGIAQMKRIETILRKRAGVAGMYTARLKEIDEIEVPYVSSEVKMSWFVYVIKLNDSLRRIHRDLLIKRLRARGIECTRYFAPIHLQPFYRKMLGTRRGDYPVTERIADRTISLPFYTNMKKDHVCRVVKMFKEELRMLKKK